MIDSSIIQHVRSALPDLVLLVGPEGSGKTFIATLLDRDLGIPSARPEAVAQALHATGHPPSTQESLAAIIAAARALAKAVPVLSLDTTGAFPDLAGYLDALGAFSRVRLVQVRAQPATCLERIRARDAAQHIPVSDAQIGLINVRSLALDLPYELVIANDPPAPPAQIVAAIAGLLASSRAPTVRASDESGDPSALSRPRS